MRISGLILLVIAATLIAAFAYTHFIECYDFFGLIKGCTAIHKP